MLVARASLFSMDVCLDRCEAMIAALIEPCQMAVSASEGQRVA